MIFLWILLSIIAILILSFILLWFIIGIDTQSSFKQNYSFIFSLWSLSFIVLWKYLTSFFKSK